MNKSIRLAFCLFYVIILLNSCAGTKPTAKPGVCPMGYVPYPQNGYGSGSDQLGQPDDVEILVDGTMIVTDVDNNRIQVYDIDGALVKSINAETLGLEKPDILPTGISKDSNGYVYISLEGAGRIARFDSEMNFVQFIGTPGKLTADNYYDEENSGILMSPQGLICSQAGDVFVIDMTPDVFNISKKNRSFRLRKFVPKEVEGTVVFTEDLVFAKSQEITKRMHKSEGMAILEEQKLMLIAEEKPKKDEYSNSEKKRFIGVFELETGKFTGNLIGVTLEEGQIVAGNHDDSIEGLAVWQDYLFAVDEKKGSVYVYSAKGEFLAKFGQRAYWYCDDESDCVIEEINYNEQSIIAGTAKPHLKNSWENNELASPDGISVMTLSDGTTRLAVVDQWNSRILYYDVNALLKALGLK